MLPVNKKLLPKILPILFIGICFIVGTIHWFSGIKQQNLNGDEPNWIAMTEIYQHRKNGDWSKFKLKQITTRKGWGNELNVLVDQPQTGKYIFGFVLDSARSNPWEKQDLSWIYVDFSYGRFPDHQSPQELVDYLGTPLTNAIEIIRFFTTTVGWLSLLLFSLIIFLYTRNFFTVGVTFLLTSFNPLLLNYFRKAMTDSISLFALFISGMLMWIGINKFLQKKSYSWIIFLIAGCSVAVASSIKLNGLFAVIFPVWFLLTIFITEPKVKTHFHQLLLCLFFFIIGFIVTFCFLEPLIWNSPISGINAILQARLLQQERFFTAFGKVNYPQVPGFALYIFFRDYSNFIAIPLFVTLYFGFTKIIKNGYNKNKTTLKTLSILLFIFATNFYYARTGFDRYFIPTVFCLFFINALGLTLLFTKVKKYVVSKI